MRRVLDAPQVIVLVKAIALYGGLNLDDIAIG